MSDDRFGRWDVYRSDLRESQLDYDREPSRRSLYTNTKPDHPRNAEGGPCNCQRGDWERGEAMRVEWPRTRERDAESREPEPRTRTRGGR